MIKPETIKKLREDLNEENRIELKFVILLAICSYLKCYVLFFEIVSIQM